MHSLTTHTLSLPLAHTLSMQAESYAGIVSGCPA
jgi:hypothetical protein